MQEILTRDDLKGIFITGATPSQDDFSNLFDSVFNKTDDGLDKAGDTGLKVQASTSSAQTDPKDLLLFYEDIGTDPSWKMRLSGQGDGWGLDLSRGADSDFLIDASGNVGIGLSAPTSKLHVQGNVLVEDDLNVRGTSYMQSQTRVYGGFLVGNSTVPGGRLVVNTAGHVGIGVTSPTCTLDVRGDTNIGVSGATANLKVSGDIGIRKTPTCALDVSGSVKVSGTTTLGTNANAANLEVYGKIVTHQNNNALHDLSVSTTLNVSGATTLASGTVTGKLGIGISSPSHKLEVNGSTQVGSMHVTGNSTTVGNARVGTDSAAIGSKGQFEVFGNGGSNHTYTGDFNVLRNQDNAHDYSSTSLSFSIGAYIEKDVACNTVVVFSDARIKNVLGVSAAPQDLQTLMGIEITDYQKKDYIQFGDRITKKVIAQQVEEVYPEAISRGTDIIPDIMEKAAVEAGWIQLKTNLQVGERVKVLMGNTSEICIVQEVRANAFLVEIPVDAKEVFVYGREVDDFRMVDYDAIAMLNVSATQELYRQLQKLQQQVAALEQPALA